MLKTRFFIAAFVLAAVFLVAAQVQADSITFGFEKVADSGMLEDFSEYLELTAKATGDGKGIDFTFISGWIDEGGVKTGYTDDIFIWNNPDYGPDWLNSVYLLNDGSVLGHDLNHEDDYEETGTHVLDDKSSPDELPVRVNGGIRLIDTVDGKDRYGLKFSVGYDQGTILNPPPTNNALFTWDDFKGIVSGLDPSGKETDPFGFRITFSATNDYDSPRATFTTAGKGEVIEQAPPVAPEPATLLILGGGLAGLGIAARRRKK